MDLNRKVKHVSDMLSDPCLAERARPLRVVERALDSQVLSSAPKEPADPCGRLVALWGRCCGFITHVILMMPLKK